MLALLLRLAADFWMTVAEMAPYLLFGFFVAGLLSVLISPRVVERHLGGSGLWPVLKASLFGIPLPLCSCGVIPVSMSLHKHGASKGSTISFLLSTPQTGADSILVTYSLLGPVLAVFRPLAALVAGLVGGTLVNLFGEDRAPSDGYAARFILWLRGAFRLAPAAIDVGHLTRPAQPIQASQPQPLDDPGGGVQDPQPAPAAGSCCHAPTRGRKFLNGMKYGFLNLPRDIGKPLMLGLAIAALISALVPDDFFAARLGRGLPAMLVMMLVGIPMYVCASASVPVAAALILKGLSPGAALVFLITGPATNAAGLATIWNTLGRRTAVLYLLTVAGCALASGLVLDFLIHSIDINIASHCHTHMGTSVVGHLAAVVLLVVLGYAFLTRRHS